MAAEIEGDHTFTFFAAMAMLPVSPTATKYSSCRRAYLSIACPSGYAGLQEWRRYATFSSRRNPMVAGPVIMRKPQQEITDRSFVVISRQRPRSGVMRSKRHLHALQLFA